MQRAYKHLVAQLGAIKRYGTSQGEAMIVAHVPREWSLKSMCINFPNARSRTNTVDRTKIRNASIAATYR